MSAAFSEAFVWVCHSFSSVQPLLWLSISRVELIAGLRTFRLNPLMPPSGGLHIKKGTVEPVADPVTNRMLWVVELEVPFILQGAIPGSHIPPVWLLPPALSCHSVSRICRAGCTRLTGGIGHPTHQILAIALVSPPGTLPGPPLWGDVASGGSRRD